MPASRSCKVADCDFPAMKRRQKCGWHWLEGQPADVQARAAKRRLARTPESARRSRVPKDRWPAKGRWCAGCQSMIPLFYCRGSRCRACVSTASHGAAIEKTFGITAARYAELLALQGGRCAICRNRPRSKRLAVDHDHDTGEVRGLCCVRCNHKLLGAAHDDVGILKAAVYYLENPPAAGRWESPSAAIARRSSTRNEEATLRDTTDRQSDPPF